MWYSATTSLNRDLLNDDCMFGICNKVADVTLGHARSDRFFTDTHTKRFFLTALKMVTMTQVSRWGWRPVTAMRGWENDGQPDLLLEHVDDDPEHFLDVG